MQCVIVILFLCLRRSVFFELALIRNTMRCTICVFKCQFDRKFIQKAPKCASKLFHCVLEHYTFAWTICVNCLFAMLCSLPFTRNMRPVHTTYLIIYTLVSISSIIYRCFTITATTHYSVHDRARNVLCPFFRGVMRLPASILTAIEANT